MDIDFSEYDDAELVEIGRLLEQEKRRRREKNPKFYQDNLTKSLLKTYEQYSLIFVPRKNPDWDLYNITGLSFEQFKTLMSPYLPKKLSQVMILSLTPIDSIITKRREEWKQQNQNIKNGFCVFCDRYYLGETCNKH